MSSNAALPNANTAEFGHFVQQLSFIKNIEEFEAFARDYLARLCAVAEVRVPPSLC